MNKSTNGGHWHILHNDWLGVLKFYKEALTLLSDLRHDFNSFSANWM